MNTSERILELKVTAPREMKSEIHTFYVILSRCFHALQVTFNEDLYEACTSNVWN